MTVGDLIQGYNTRPSWLLQMTEFRGVMDELNAPWFPVAGNHDIYWRGPGRTADEHESDYEDFFGPLWYAFDHKGCRFIVLYTDEGNPETGERSFSKPDCQQMSPEQKSWLADTLASAGQHRHVFVFCHHPRWRGGQYGDDWNEVHDMMAEAGNVTAVFAGHVHRLQYDGERDGIEYLSLATVGGGLPAEPVAAIGHLHHVTLVMVRDEGIAMASIPVGGVIDPRAMTADHQAAVQDLLAKAPRGPSILDVQGTGIVNAELPLQLENPLGSPVEWSVRLESEDPRWVLRPDHLHVTLAPGETRSIPCHLHHPGPLDSDWEVPKWISTAVFQDEAGSWETSSLVQSVRVQPRNLAEGSEDGCLRIQGGNASGLVASERIPLHDGSLTIEAWVRPEDLSGRRGILAKTESSEYGLFGSDGRPSFHILLDGAYCEAYAERELDLAKWSHVAGVFDAEQNEIRLYVNGELAASAPATGKRRLNNHPLIVGGDVDGGGHAVSGLTGCIDEVRLSSSARYREHSFVPSLRHAPDAETVLLLHLDAASGPFLPDASGREAWGVLQHGAEIITGSAAK